MTIETREKLWGFCCLGPEAVEGRRLNLLAAVHPSPSMQGRAKTLFKKCHTDQKLGFRSYGYVRIRTRRPGPGPQLSARLRCLLTFMYSGFPIVGRARPHD